ncbi:hypothetical protein I4F81_011831 [Pyropia yezoensis]|uniref:Uncharacterized protein n=1 Tax=Pyropia yezoensis TaxID=2788 RepID=A0ACC3CGQ6_PYRYE|nr:hypothetical protein I4F81_011831 [Neopyropia yezoensis]
MGAERTEIDILSLHPARLNHLPPALLTLTPSLVPFHPTDLSEGMKVKVAVPTLMYHVPKRGGEPLDLQGLTGSVKKVIGDGISANRPVVVQFVEPAKFFGHFDAEELELVED